jgi:hypothetical protein
MNKSRPEGVRWVINGVDERTIRTVREVGARYDVFLAQVVDEAVYQLASILESEDYTPDGWTRPTRD